MQRKKYVARQRRIREIFLSHVTTGAAKTILNSTDSNEISNQQTNVFVAAKSPENTASVTIKLKIFSRETCVSKKDITPSVQNRNS